MARDVARFIKAEARLWESYGLAPREHRLDLAAGHQVRVQELGEGPPVLLVHGAGSGGALWAPLIARLPEFRCLALDRPGCGLSEPVAARVPTSTVEEFNRYAESLMPEVLDALDIDRAHVVSTSLGGYFAVHGAAAHPERVHRIVHHAYCFGAPIEQVPWVMRLGTLPGFEAMSARIPPTRSAIKVILRQIGLKRALGNGRFTPELFEWFLALLRDTETMLADLRSAPSLITPRGMNPEVVIDADVLAGATPPCLFIWGDEDPMGGEEIARPFVDQFPNGQLEIVTEAGHAPFIDEPEHCAELMRSFLGDA